MDLGIVIVSYNVRDLLGACLRSVFASLKDSQLDAEVWVVDNASADGSPDVVRDEFPQVHLIALDQNMGFAAANNMAMRQMGFWELTATSPQGKTRTTNAEQAGTRPRHVLLLNPDTEVRGQALQTLVDFMDQNPGVGVVGPRLVYPDGGFQHSAFAFPGVAQTFFDFFPVHGRLLDSRLNGRYPKSAYADGPFPVDHPLGACLMARGEAIHQVGLLDEGFFMYCEEIDWCMRFKRAGWQVYCMPAAEVVHHVAQSTRQFREAMFVALWRSRFHLYAKHYGPLKRWAIRQVARAGIRWQMRRAGRELTGPELERRLNAYQTVLAMTG